MRTLEEIRRDTKIALNAGMYAFLDLLELEALNKYGCTTRPYHPIKDVAPFGDYRLKWVATELIRGDGPLKIKWECDENHYCDYCDDGQIMSHKGYIDCSMCDGSGCDGSGCDCGEETIAITTDDGLVIELDGEAI